MSRVNIICFISSRCNKFGEEAELCNISVHLHCTLPLICQIWNLLFSSGAVMFSSVQFSSVQSVKVGIRNNLQFKSRSVIKMMLVLTIFTCHSAVGYSLYLRKNATRVPVILVINPKRVTRWGQTAKVLVKIFWLQFDNKKNINIWGSLLVCNSIVVKVFLFSVWAGGLWYIKWLWWWRCSE